MPGYTPPGLKTLRGAPLRVRLNGGAPSRCPVPDKVRLTQGAWELLKLLASKGAITEPVRMSSREIGELLSVSQQTADNYLVALEVQGYLSRTLIARKQQLTVTAEGVQALRSNFLDLKAIFEKAQNRTFSGTVVSGVGEGRYYLSKKGYTDQFVAHLGYLPFPGTLNVRLDGKSSSPLEEVRRLHGIRIEGFEAEGRTFGGATCYSARLAGADCHLILPDRTHYQNVFEFIAPKSLRKSLRLKDGTEVPIEVLA